MRKYDCTTGSIEIEESVSLASADYREDFEPRGLRGACGRLATAAILVLATTSGGIGAIEPVGALTTTFPTKVAVRQTAARYGKRISLAEACRRADELQDHIDAQYRHELEHDAQIGAVWEDAE